MQDIGAIGIEPVPERPKCRPDSDLQADNLLIENLHFFEKRALKPEVVVGDSVNWHEEFVAAENNLRLLPLPNVKLTGLARLFLQGRVDRRVRFH